MSLILRCTECDARLPNQYAPLGGKCGGDECVKLDSGPVVASWPEHWGVNPLAELRAGELGLTEVQSNPLDLDEAA